MELHHDKHHRTYVNSYNTAMEKMEEVQSKSDIQGQIAQQPLINFHGGPYISYVKQETYAENVANDSSAVHTDQ